MARKTTPTGAPPEEPTKIPVAPGEESQQVPVPEDPEENLEEYEQHRLDILAKLPPEADRPKNIYARLAQINGHIGLIRKTGRNTFHNYKFAKEADLVEAIRPLLSEYGIWVEQGLFSSPELGMIPHQRLSIMKGGSDESKQRVVESLTVITKVFNFAWWNPESGQLEKTEPQTFMGYGDDAGDKGYYKAETGAVKYFLMKSFMVATDNDPEGDASADRRAAARDAAPNVNVQRGGQNRPQSGQQRPGGVNVQHNGNGGSQAQQNTAQGGRRRDAVGPVEALRIAIFRLVPSKKAEDILPILARLSGKEATVGAGQQAAQVLPAFIASFKPDELIELVKKTEALADGLEDAAAEKENTGGAAPEDVPATAPADADDPAGSDDAVADGAGDGEGGSDEVPDADPTAGQTGWEDDPE